MTTTANEFEQEAKEHLAFLMWGDRVMDEIYQEEVNQELLKEENNQ